MLIMYEGFVQKRNFARLVKLAKDKVLHFPCSFPECSLKLPCTFPECSKKVPCMFPSCIHTVWNTFKSDTRVQTLHSVYV